MADKVFTADKAFTDLEHTLLSGMPYERFKPSRLMDSRAFLTSINSVFWHPPACFFLEWNFFKAHKWSKNGVCVANFRPFMAPYGEARATAYAKCRELIAKLGLVEIV